jgi:putative ABC transport system permease protein
MAKGQKETSIRIIDLLGETFSAVTANKTRSSLTMLGIVIGIASVISMVAIGAGSQASIESNIQSLGSNLLTVQPGASRTVGSTVSSGRGNAKTLTNDDAAALTSLQGVKTVSPEATANQQIVAGGNNTNASIIGSQPVYSEVHNVQIDAGSWFSAGQVSDYAKVAVIGPTIAKDLFGTVAASSIVGQTVNIGSIPFTVVGVTVSKGGSGFNNSDNAVYIPLTTAQQFLTGSAYLGSIAVEASSQSVMTQVENEINAALLQRHHISDPNSADFSVTNQADIVSTISSVSSTFTNLLAAIAAISLVVGGIGIMNMMLTTVTERTREIGLRKAIGAQRSDITLQFLAEAMSLTIFGGIIGIAFGWITCWVMTHFFSVSTQMSSSSILLAFGVSAGIGVLFGYYPAVRASKLNPIEALRYE